MWIRSTIGEQIHKNMFYYVRLHYKEEPTFFQDFIPGQPVIILTTILSRAFRFDLREDAVKIMRQLNAVHAPFQAMVHYCSTM